MAEDQAYDEVAQEEYVDDMEEGDGTVDVSSEAGALMWGCAQGASRPSLLARGPPRCSALLRCAALRRMRLPAAGVRTQHGTARPCVKHAAAVCMHHTCRAASTGHRRPCPAFGAPLAPGHRSRPAAPRAAAAASRARSRAHEKRFKKEKKSI